MKVQRVLIEYLKLSSTDCDRLALRGLSPKRVQRVGLVPRLSKN